MTLTSRTLALDIHALVGHSRQERVAVNGCDGRDESAMTVVGQVITSNREILPYVKMLYVKNQEAEKDK